MDKDHQAEKIMLAATQQFFILLNNSNGGAEQWRQISANDGTGLADLRERLERFDDELSAGELRRYFEEFGTPAKADLESLLRFYLSKPTRKIADRDKIDLIITRWGTLAVTENEVFLQRASDLDSQLMAIFQELRLPVEKDSGEAAIIAELINEREAFKSIRSLRELIDRQTLVRLRKIKDKMAELFFRPAILVELVEVNLSLHNIFQELLIIEQARLSVAADADSSLGSLDAAENEAKISDITPMAATRDRLIVTLYAVKQALEDLTRQAQNLIAQLQSEQ
jgi:hypothetical protein